MLHSNLFVASGYLIGIVSLMITIVIYRKSKKEKRPCYTNRTNNLIFKSESRISDLIITAKYKGVEVESLSYTKFAFWNAGKDTIVEKDMSSVDPLRLEVDNDVMIYECNLIFESKKANCFKIDLDKDHNIIYIDFAYLSFSQGAIIKILHSGNADSYKTNKVHLKGELRGVNKIENPHPSFAPTNFLMETNIFFEDNNLA